MHEIHEITLTDAEYEILHRSLLRLMLDVQQGRATYPDPTGIQRVIDSLREKLGLHDAPSKF